VILDHRSPHTTPLLKVDPEAAWAPRRILSDITSIVLRERAVRRALIPETVNRTYTMEIDGDKLTLTSDPFVAGTTGQRIISIRTFERAE
jgi:hypothetical protein